MRSLKPLPANPPYLQAVFASPKLMPFWEMMALQQSKGGSATATEARDWFFEACRSLQAIPAVALGHLSSAAEAEEHMLLACARSLLRLLRVEETVRKHNGWTLAAACRCGLKAFHVPTSLTEPPPSFLCASPSFSVDSSPHTPSRPVYLSLPHPSQAQLASIASCDLYSIRPERLSSSEEQRFTARVPPFNRPFIFAIRVPGLPENRPAVSLGDIVYVRRIQTLPCATQPYATSCHRF